MRILKSKVFVEVHLAKLTEFWYVEDDENIYTQALHFGKVLSKKKSPIVGYELVIGPLLIALAWPRRCRGKDNKEVAK